MSDLREQRERANERLRHAVERLQLANDELRAAEREHSFAMRDVRNLDVPDVCLQPRREWAR